MSDQDTDDLTELAELVVDRNDVAPSVTSSRRGRTSPPRYRGDGVEAVDERGQIASSDEQMWAVYGNRNFVPCEKAVPELIPGQYTISINDRWGIYWHREDVNLDELLILPDSKSEQVINEIKHFWTLEEQFRNFGYLWKRGVLLWGPPGSGKTSTLQIISRNVVDAGGISVYVDNPERAGKGLKMMRQVEPQRPLVVMLEDIDAIIDEYGESELLALMDGELQIDNVVFVATTNYPKRLDKRFVNRPSRFDILKKIGMPTAAARHTYLTVKNPRMALPENEKELQQWIDGTKEFSVAHLKELIVSVEIFRQPLQFALQRLRKMMEVLPDNDSTGQFGFIHTNDDE